MADSFDYAMTIESEIALQEMLDAPLEVKKRRTRKREVDGTTTTELERRPWSFYRFSKILTSRNFSSALFDLSTCYVHNYTAVDYRPNF